MTLQAGTADHKELNMLIKESLKHDLHVQVKHVTGQRYIGSAMKAGYHLHLVGTPGNDLGCYMDGGEIEVTGNAQDGTGNTMNDGSIVIHGNCGDAAGYAMRGGSIYIKGNAGYRVGIHMKEYMDKKPVLVIGGCTGDFLGEYMAGGIVLVLGLDCGGNGLTGRFCATGIHGGVIYMRGEVDKTRLGREATVAAADAEDMKVIASLVQNYCNYFGGDAKEIINARFLKISAASKRPYGKMYVGV